ncbi:sulfatase-like hydrolase/transferase [Haloarcula sp. NS06]|uniref:sulfatase-like hydrolase/transferase n=1 Tax=Haloarcula sp. NS06 TaxID=3409688 RepID=UPI003DA75763
METVSELYSMLLDDSTTLTNEEIGKMRNLYRAAIVYVDGQINRLIKSLESTGQLANTLIVLTSDHGELFGEHGQYGKPERMYDELIQVPLVVVNGPAEISNATDDLVSLLDLPPMFHQATDIGIPNEYEGQTVTSTTRDYIVSEHEVEGNPIVGVRSEDWLYEIDELRDEARLTEIQTGHEIQSMTQAEKEAVADIKTAAERRVDCIESDVGSSNEPHLERDVESRLEDLGYR